MSKITTVLIDEESSCLASLAGGLTQYCPQVKIVGKFTNPKEGLKAIRQLQPDLVMLEVEMPEGNGFELLSEVKESVSHFIFVTHNHEFGAKAFRANAVDYLLKPIHKMDLIEAIHKVEERFAYHATQQHLGRLLDNFTRKERVLPNIAVPTMEGLEFITIDHIVYCEADNNYTIFHLLDGTKTTISKTLKDIEAMLDHQHFQRVHQSFLVNLTRIRRYVKKNGGYLIMSTGENIAVSRSKKEELIEVLKV